MSEPTAPAVSTVPVLGIPIARLTERETMERIAAYAADRGAARPHFVTYANPHCLNVSRSNPAYAQALREAEIVYADGDGVVWATRALGAPCPERVTASDFLKDFVKIAEERGLRLYLLGGHPGTADRMAEGLKALAPRLGIVGTQHGFFTDEESGAVIDAINRSGADILLLGMSVPKQEEWVAANRGRLRVPLAWCVGGSFEFYSGATKRAPQWVINAHMEWFYRFLQEPRRMWKRYFIGNLSFVTRVYIQRWGFLK
ncbi:MAG: WecB/TagA/CpsF family glycosyltransferase [Myxococcales bacterium]|nr:WecB/TagA/CpsF family glycosyltransferase [Myxococcales bacterium]